MWAADAQATTHETHVIRSPANPDRLTLDELHVQVRDAVRCHFDEGKAPPVIRLHFVRDEVIAT